MCNYNYVNGFQSVKISHIGFSESQNPRYVTLNKRSSFNIVSGLGKSLLCRKKMFPFCMEFVLLSN